MEKIETSLMETKVNMDTFLDEAGTMDVGLKNKKKERNHISPSLGYLHYYFNYSSVPNKPVLQIKV